MAKARHPVRAAVRAILAPALRRAPFTSELLGPPRGFHATTREWLTSGSRSAAESRFREFFPAHSSVRGHPLTPSGTVPWPFETHYGGYEPTDGAGWVVEILGGRVAGNGAVITGDDRLLGDVSRELIVGGDQSEHSIRGRVRLGPVRKVAGTVAVLAVVDVNYWHWFFDLLPRILLLKQDPELFRRIDHFVVNPISRPYQRETLAWLGVPEEKLIEGRPSPFHLKADLLLVPSVFRDVPARWACRKLRDEFRDPSGPGGGPSRVYISRGDARTRRVANEDVLVKRLANLGFERVTLSGLSVAEQRSLFASAEVVVAPHGAGLTNLLFCPEGARVVEIFPPTYVNPCYWVLAEHLGLGYACSVGEGDLPPQPPPGSDPGRWFWSFVDEGAEEGMMIRARVDEVVRLTETVLNASGAATRLPGQVFPAAPDPQ